MVVLVLVALVQRLTLTLRVEDLLENDAEVKFALRRHLCPKY